MTDLEAIREDHKNECAVCRYTSEGPCSIAVLLAENERLREVAVHAQAMDGKKPLVGYAWCETAEEVVGNTCHWDCESCTTVCPGPHLALVVTDQPAEG